MENSSIATITIAMIIAMIITLVIIMIKKKKEHMDECDRLVVHQIASQHSEPCVGLIGGVHGNEPAGSVALENLVSGKWQLPLKRGKLIVIPSANQCGLANNQRWQPSILRPDLNRNFTSEGGTDYKSQQITQAFQNCDLVIDIHEGWGFHKVQPASLGSTLSPTETPLARRISRDMLNAINRTIPDPDKHFTQLDDISCDIPTTLSCYMNDQNHSYILIEITGQNDIQPIELREQQARTLITAALTSLNMI